jgi:hypothetical protein
MKPPEALMSGLVGHLVNPGHIPCATGFMLEVVSVLSGIGVMVKSAKVRTCDECSQDPAVTEMLTQETVMTVRNSRVMEFEVSEMSGEQLSERSVQAVLFTLGLVTGNGKTENTIVPTLRSYATHFREDD